MKTRDLGLLVVLHIKGRGFFIAEVLVKESSYPRFQGGGALNIPASYIPPQYRLQSPCSSKFLLPSRLTLDQI